MSCWVRCLSVLGPLLVLAACAGTETDNPIVGGEPPVYDSPSQFNPESDAPPGCVPPIDSGKPRRLPLWGHDGTLIVGADRYSGLRVIDASDPAQPKVTAQLALAGEPRTLLVQSGAAVTLAIDEVPELHQDSVPDPVSLEPVTRLVRYDASDPSALVRLADVAIEGELWSVQQRGELTWVMSANPVNPQLSCDRTAYDCGYVARGALVLTGYHFVGNAWEVVQRVELRMDTQAWATPEGYAGYEALGDAEGNSAGGIVRAVRFQPDGRLSVATELQVPREIVWGAPLSLAGDHARVLLRDFRDGSVQLATFDLTSGDMLSLLQHAGSQAGPTTRFDAHGVYLGDEGSQQGAVFIDTSDPGAPVASSFPMPISRVVPLDEQGTRLLGVSPGSSGNGLAFSLLQPQGRSFGELANVSVQDAVAMPDSEALWLDGERVFYGYQRRDGSYALGLVVAGAASLTSIDIVADGYPDELVALDETAYVPDEFGLHVVPLDDGVDGPHLEWNVAVSADAVAASGEYEAALVHVRSEPIALELTRGADTQRFDVSAGARGLAADDDYVLVLSTEPADQCAQSGRDCSDYSPNVELFALGDAPHRVVQLALPDADLIANDSDRQVRLDWETEQQGRPLGGGRYLFVAEIDATCTSAAACQSLAITARPIGESGLNVTSGAPAPCAPNATSCEQAAPQPAPTVYGAKRAQRFYVLDASGSEPSFGPAAESVLERSASRFGPPRVSEGRVLATRIERDQPRPTPGVSSVPSDVSSFMLDRFELADDGSLRALPVLNVPGYPLALRADGSVLISAEPDAEHEGAATLYRLALREHGAYSEQTLALDSRYGEIEVADGFAFYLRRDGEGCSGTTELVPIRLPDDARGALRALPSLELPGVDWTVADAHDGRLLLSSAQRRLAVIDIGAGDGPPQLRTFVSTASYLDHPQLNGDTIIGAGALWGKQHLAL